MLRDVIRTLVAEDSALELAGALDKPDLAAALAMGADVVVYSREAGRGPGAEELLRRRCAVRFLEVAEDGGAATVFEMRPHRQSLGELGASRLLAVLRGTDGS